LLLPNLSTVTRELRSGDTKSLWNGRDERSGYMMDFVASMPKLAESMHVSASLIAPIPKRLRVADYEGSLVTVLKFGRSNIRWVYVEPQIFDLREPGNICAGPHPISMTLSPGLARTWL